MISFDDSDFTGGKVVSRIGNGYTQEEGIIQILLLYK